MFFSCTLIQSGKQRSALLTDSRNIIKSNLEFLASDELEGREATTRGAKIAAQYIASQLKQYGVKPMGDSGTYFQNFELQRSYFQPDSKLIFITNKTDSLQLTKDFIPFEKGMSVNNSTLIYVKFGITDSLNNYDDYKDLDVKGKTVLCFSGEPSRDNDPEFFKKTVTDWRSSANKAALAKQKGAVGMILLQSPFWVRHWKNLSRRYTQPAIGPLEKDSINAAWLDSSLAKNIFALNQLKYDQLLDTLRSGYIKTGSVIKLLISWNLDKQEDFVKARNLVGIVDGSDKSLSDEIVSMGAHYDHLGIRNGKIYNGADDNGSGTVTVMECARQIASLKSNKRPVLFIFYTAEEKGLLGSDYFVNHFDLIHNIIANINMDMVGRESIDTMYVIGSGRISNEFYNIVEKANAEASHFHFNYTYDDPSNPERFYYRSDHWKFAQKNIPIVFFTDMHRTDYHKPTDDADKINYSKLLKTSHLATQIALKVANLDHKLVTNKEN